jgi:hypothetical protein
VQHSQKAKEEYYIEKAKQVYTTENEKIAGKDYNLSLTVCPLFLL